MHNNIITGILLIKQLALNYLLGPKNRPQQGGFALQYISVYFESISPSFYDLMYIFSTQTQALYHYVLVIF